MHVGLNLVFLVPGEQGGMEVYARELLRALPAVRPDLRVTAFVNREARAAGGEWDEFAEVVEVPVFARSRVQWVRGEQLLLPGLARRAGVDLVHSLASTAPARGRFRRVATIHDLMYRVVPDAHFGVLGLGMRVLVPTAAHRSHRVIVLSEATRADLRRYLHVPAGRIDVVPPGCGATPAGEPEPAAVLRERHGLGRRRVALSVSAKRPHKNLVRLFEALAAIAPERRPVLVIPGYPTPYEATLRERAAELGIGDDLRLLDWVSGPELEGLYALADVSVFPSLYEGFGLPVLEAMRRGVPVACSDRSSMPEAAGGAALLFDPDDAGAITAAIERVLGDPALAQRLRDAGRLQAERFSWAACARGTAESYDRAMARRGVCVGRRDAVQRPRERQALAVLLKPGRRRCPQGRARGAHAQDRVGDVLRRGRGGDEAVATLVDELGRRVVRIGHHDARHAERSSLDDHEPIALPARRQHHAQRARQRLGEDVVATKPGASATSARPSEAIRARTSARSGPSP